MTDKIIQVNNLRKSYGNIQAVKGLSFYVEKGGLFAFLGKNGAGKSTTIDIITTFLSKDSGEVIIDGLTLGKNDNQIRNIIGAVFQDNVLDRNLTVKENIAVRGSLYGLRGNQLKQAVENAVVSAEVGDFQNRYYGKLSGGQRRRADIARALVNTPKILFLDEPTTGLDPQTRKNVWQTIQRLQRETGMTVFLTTHYMEEASQADYIVVIDNGTISAKGTPSQLKDKYAGDFLKLCPKKPDYDSVILLLKNQNISFSEISGTIKINLPNTMDSLPILETVKSNLESFEVVNGTMDDAFIAITGKEVKE